jgi:hypothetical protein
MSLSSPIFAVRVARILFALVTVLTALAAQAEFLRVTAANSVGNLLYDVTSFAPPPGATNALNTDGASHGSFRALVLVPNEASGTVDVLVAETVRGQIIRYTPALGATPASESVVWSYSGNGPAHPDGLSVDSAGNLFIVTSKLNDSTTNALWVLPVSAGSATGYAASPLLIDQTFGTANGVKTLQETLVATTTTAAWASGDLLVLVGNGSSSNSQKNSNDANVLRYTASTIASVLNGGGAHTGPDAVIINPGQFPAGEYPTGMDVWPADALVSHPTLLTTTTAGRLLRFDFSASGKTVVPTLLPVFASGLGSGLNKVKVGQRLGVPYAFVSQALSSSSGAILQLAAPATPGTTNLIGTATQSVQSPDALAVTTFAAAAASTCTSGCDISGGVIPHDLVTNGTQPSGNVIEGTCVIAKDPRVTGGVCDGTTLKVAALCAGFGNEVIPGHLCGGSGASGSGFALVRSIANGVDHIAGLLNYSTGDPDQILPALSGQMNPQCPSVVVGWVPRSDANPSEGSIVEVDPATGLLQMIDLTGFCDAGGGVMRGASIYSVGLVVNLNGLAGGLTGFAQSKYDNLFKTVDTANIAPASKTALEASLGQIDSYLAQGDYGCAAVAAVASDALAASDPTANYPGNSANPNPWGEIRGRLANLYYTLNTRILGLTANVAWPLASSDSRPPCPPPVVTLTATPSSVPPNSAATLQWSSQHATACTATQGNAGDGWSGSKSLNGSQSTGALAATTSYTLNCTGIAGSTGAVATVTVVPPPAIKSFSANPSSVSRGSASTLTWSASNAASCAITGGSLNASNLAASGSRSTGSLSATTTFQLTCLNTLNVAASSSVTVKVVVHDD